ncbi:MAG: PQQ-binding-like beta-propeller repeat protein [Planctomycetales bacterium]
MSHTTETDSTSLQPEQTPAAAQIIRPPLRLWLPTLVVIAYWLIVQGSYQWEMAMFYRFLTRMLTLLATMIFFLVWWFAARHFRWKEKFAMFGLLIGGIVVAGLLGDKTTGIPAMMLLGLPVIYTLGVAWLWLAKRQTNRTQLLGLCAVLPITLVPLALLRWDGLDGRQQTQLSWRWTPTAEERFRENQELAIRKTDGPLPSNGKELKAKDGDWTSFRGGNHENIITGMKLADWSSAPPKELWKHRVGPGWSSVIAVGDYLFTQEQRGTNEAIVCYQAVDGKEKWSTGTPARLEDALAGTGPRGTPTFDENRIYALGTQGDLTCVDARTGNKQWTRNIIKEEDGAVPQWGSATSPLVVDGFVVAFAGGKKGGSLVAYEKTSGKPAWKAAGGTVSYTTPQVMTLGGMRQIVMQDELGLYGVQIADGKLLWKHPCPHAGSFQPMLQPHPVEKDGVIVGWDAGILRLKIAREGNEWKLSEVWKSNRLKPSFNEFAIHKGHIYGFDDGILCCVDLAKGDRKWKSGRYGFGQLLLLPDVEELLISTEQGDVVRVAAQAAKFKELGKVKAIEGKTWNHPMVAHGKLILRNGEEMACFQIGEKPTASDPPKPPLN